MKHNHRITLRPRRHQPSYWPLVGAAALFGVLLLAGSVPALRRYLRLRSM